MTGEVTTSRCNFAINRIADRGFSDKIEHILSLILNFRQGDNLNYLLDIRYLLIKILYFLLCMYHMCQIFFSALSTECFLIVWIGSKYLISVESRMKARIV